jgi:RNA 2',3'-cyclic 3'-phosphodiesterase
MTRRIFVAVPISRELQEVILDWEKSFKDLPVRWLAGKDLHVTLIPPWQTDDIDSVLEKLKTVQGKFEPFDIEFNKVTYGPTLREPRLVWATGKVSKPMIALKDELEKIFPEYKLPHDPWTMHLTLARFKPETFSSFPVKNLDEYLLWPERVSSIVLMESHPGSNYEVLEEIPLVV